MATSQSRSGSADKSDAISTIKKSISSYKGKVSGIAGRADMIKGTCQDDPAECRKNLMIMQDMFEKLSGYYDTVSEKYIELVGLDPSRKQEWTDERDDFHKEYQKVYLPLADFVSKYSAPDANSGGTSQSSDTAISVALAIRASSMQDQLKPGKLERSMTPVEFRQWEKQYKNYYTATRMELMSYDEQVQMLLSNLSPALQQAVGARFEAANSIWNGDESCMKLLRRHFMSAYPLLDRRATFWDVKHQPGEDWSSYVARARSLATEAELQPHMTAEEITAMVLLNGIRHKKLLEKILNKWGSIGELPTPEEIEREGIIYWQTAGTSGRMLGGEGGKSARDGNKSRSANDQRGTKVVCRRCQKSGHDERECRSTKSCNFCGVLGHLEKNCWKKNGKDKSKSRKRTASRSPGHTPGRRGSGGRSPRRSPGRSPRRNSSGRSASPRDRRGRSPGRGRPAEKSRRLEVVQETSPADLQRQMQLLQCIARNLQNAQGSGSNQSDIPANTPVVPGAEYLRPPILAVSPVVPMPGTSTQYNMAVPPLMATRPRPEVQGPEMHSEAEARERRVASEISSCMQRLVITTTGPTVVTTVAARTTATQPATREVTTVSAARSTAPVSTPAAATPEVARPVVDRQVRPTPSTSTSTPAASRTIEEVTLEDDTPPTRYVQGLQTPKINCLFEDVKSGNQFRYLSLPDTGCTKSVISAYILEKYDISYTKSWDLSLTTASGSSMKVRGYVDLLCVTDQGSAPIQALVVDSCSDGIMLSWHDLVSIGSIPASFPLPDSSNSFHESWCKALITGSLNDNGKMLSAEIQSAKEMILSSYTDTLTDSLNGSVIKDAVMKIDLMENVDIQPSYISSPRPVPLHHRESADKVIKKLIDSGVIEPVTWPTEWCSPAHFVPKAGTTEVRLVTDFTRLNKYVRRPVHPFQTGAEILRQIKPTSKFFCKLDLISGYHQIFLEKASRDLTTFLVPSGLGSGNGRFAYLRGPMGLASTGDYFCIYTDKALSGLDLFKLVDDILIEADTLPELIRKVKAVLDRCREVGILVSRRKFQMGTAVPFAGHIVSGDGIKIDPKMTESLRNFPVPKNVSDVRSFLGLANQFTQFLPDLAHATLHIRQLLKKSVDFVWSDKHQTEFERAKSLLCSTQLVKPFDCNLPTYLLTDASKLYGLGYMLLQYKGEVPRVIKCGSTSLTDTQSRYATIELEMLGIQYAISSCQYYLLGCQVFHVVTDHRPLLGIFKKDLRDVTNARLQRLREKIVNYNFTVEWRPGKLHSIADALSRYPVFKGEASDVFNSELSRKITDLRDEPTMQFIWDAAKSVDYHRVVLALRNGRDLKQLQQSHPARCLKGVWHQLSLYDDHEYTLIMVDGQKIFVPEGARRKLLHLWHNSHAGEKKIKLMAQSSFYWPHMSNEIKQLVQSCSSCMRNLPSKCHKPKKGGTSILKLNPMDEVSFDLFTFEGEWLIMVDRYSGYFMIEKLNSTTTSAVLKVAEDWFNTFGWPKRVRADNGPQFRSDFDNFLTERNIKRESSSPYHHESNGLVEASVKNAKTLLERCKDAKIKWQPALQDFLNCPNVTSGVKPATLFWQRPVRSSFPLTESEINIREAEILRDATLSSDSHSKPKFKVGDKVLVQNMKSKKWTDHGVITEIRDNGQSYFIDLQDGSNKLRNVRYLKLDHTKVQTFEQDIKSQISVGSAVSQHSEECKLRGILKNADGHLRDNVINHNDQSVIKPLRRSDRLKKKRVSFQIDS